MAKSGSVEEMRAVIHELEEELDNAEFELEIDEAILSGDWPSAGEYAERILAKVALRTEAAS